MIDLSPLYLYSARVVSIIDGDTFDLGIDLGFGIEIRDRVRLFGVNCPEISSSEGIQAVEYINSLVKVDQQITIRSIKNRREQYGRYLVIIYLESDPNKISKSLNRMLLESGNAVAKYISKQNLELL